VLRPSIDAIEAQKPPKRENRERLRSLLQQIWWSNLSKRPEYVDTKMLHARYPLISLHDRKSGLDVQIVLANDTSISRSYMEKYMAEYPYLRPVYFVIKAMFDVRGLSNVFRGGFGSYTLFMMLVASIQHMPNQRNDASGALFGFLRFWRNFDTTTHGVSIDPVELYEKNVSKDIMPPKARDRLEVTSPIPYSSCSY
jgi:non-canonical poly(A) RNA polymerase PAPD5/7